MRKALHVSVYSLVLVFFIGCALKPETTEINTYNLSINTNVVKSEKTSCSNKNISFSMPTGTIGAFYTKIYYSKFQGQLQPYTLSYWAEVPAISIKRSLFYSLLNSNVFNSVMQSGYPGSENYMLESNIFIFEHNIRNDKSYIEFGIIFSLVDGSKKNTVATKEIWITKNTSSIDAKGAVLAFNLALDDINKELAIWLKKVVCE